MVHDVRHAFSILAVTCLLTGCPSNGPTTQVTPSNEAPTQDAARADSDTEPLDVGEPDASRTLPNGTVIIDVDPQPISPGGVTTITATVDPGLAVRSIRVLESGDGHVFDTMTEAPNGTYTLTLTWDQLHPFDRRTETLRGFDAVVELERGPPGSVGFVIGFECGSAGLAICSGQCVDLDTDPKHCGTCGNSDGADDYECVDGQFGCPGGVWCDGACIPSPGLDEDVSNCGACGNDCYDAFQDVPGVIVSPSCFASECTFTARDTRVERTCDDICDATGMRCRASERDGLNCAQAPFTFSPGCAVYKDDTSGCTVNVPSRCDAVPVAPDKEDAELSCGKSADELEFQTISCICAP